ncbi:MAG TPA: glutamate-1-semialdehyde 2,1-aminomutase [Vicinamibacterales bacterium]|nr:glutamate-1-semialdehyde 2,1-aminomutase [Vicinamibacterales bacterium]
MPFPLDDYAARTPGSRAWYERARAVLPAGVSYGIRDLAPYPFYVDRAEGPRVWDVDGNEYIDYWCGHGALILGHAAPPAVEAACRQAARGSHFGFAHTLEVEMAEMVQRLVPGAEMVRYTNSGTEANMYALALARAFTGRARVAKMEGGWHGGLESLNTAVHAPFGEPEALGLNPHATADTEALPFNDLDAARRALARGDLAALFVEPMMGAAGCIAAEPGYLEGLRELCTRHGTVLVFDEVITGFRVAPGGAQQHYGVTPDITTLGKILGGGFPIGALCGRQEVFERLDHRRFGGRSDRAFQGGTFSGNPVSLAAGLATLRQLEGGEVHERLGRLAARLRDGIAAAFAEHGVPVGVTGLGSAVGVHFRSGAPRNAAEASADDLVVARRYFDYMLGCGIVFLLPTSPHLFVSAAHTEAEIDGFLAATREFAPEARRSA